MDIQKDLVYCPRLIGFTDDITCTLPSGIYISDGHGTLEQVYSGTHVVPNGDGDHTLRLTVERK